ncbi:MAG: TSCPD domain-containing protein [Faecalibacterium prausnitzii]
MSKSFSFPNVGTCSKQTNIVLNDDHTIESVEVIGGCNGNLKGISRLLKGMKAEMPSPAWRVPPAAPAQLPRPDRQEPEKALTEM